VRAGADPPADIQIRDYQSALSYLERREDVDENRLGAWGISYSGGHVLILAATDPRVKAVVSQIPVVERLREHAPRARLPRVPPVLVGDPGAQLRRAAVRVADLRRPHRDDRRGAGRPRPAMPWPETADRVPGVQQWA
jgi:dienelactone hydrolase